MQRLYSELDERGIRFRPHVWLSEEWFSPDGVPGIAVPFYLAHPRLMRLERKMTREVEGGNVNWLMRILRHEAGHAIDSAYRLRRRAHWRALFGPASTPYRSRYRARPASRHHVQHLGDWYAQSHPTEDFAETFAVWLAPRSGWQRRYASWPALRKLRFVQQIAGEIRRPSRRRCASRDRIEPLDFNQRTLAQHYRSKLARARTRRGMLADRLLQRVFCSTEPGRARTDRRDAAAREQAAAAGIADPRHRRGSLRGAPGAAYRDRAQRAPAAVRARLAARSRCAPRASCCAGWYGCTCEARDCDCAHEETAHAGGGALESGAARKPGRLLREGDRRVAHRIRCGLDAARAMGMKCRPSECSIH